MTELTLDVLRGATASAAAFRFRRRLQPAGGEGDKVFPPTFANAVYAIEKRRVAGRSEPVQCVLLDSVQSQANRMELALQEAVDAEKLRMPLVVVDFSKHDPTGDLEADEKAGRLLDAVGTITCLGGPPALLGRARWRAGDVWVADEASCTVTDQASKGPRRVFR